MESLETVGPAPSWARPEKQRLQLRRALPLLGGAAMIGFSLVTGMLLADEGAVAAPAVISIPIPVQVASAPAAPAPINVTVAAPEPAPAVDEPKPPLRLQVPMLDAECYGRITADGMSPRCSWDNGFPAISGDGRQIADLAIDGAMGPVDVAVVLYDVATSKEIRRMTISKFDSFDYDKQEEPAVRAKVVQRTAAAQRVLTANKFRALQSLGQHRTGYAAPEDPVDVTGDPKQVHAEWTDATMRLVDPGARVELWRHTFSAPAPKRAKPDEECGGWEMVWINGWWDPKARVVVGQLLHHHGGCMCGSTNVMQVFAL